MLSTLHSKLPKVDCSIKFLSFIRYALAELINSTTTIPIFNFYREKTLKDKKRLRSNTEIRAVTLTVYTLLNSNETNETNEMKR